MIRKLFLLFLFLICSSVGATTFSDLKFSKYQFSDTQWDVSACMYSNTCNIDRLSGIGTTYNLGYAVTIGSTQYIAFTNTGDANNPWRMKLYNSDGSLAQDLGVGKLAIQGQDASGNNFFFFTNDDWNGTVFSLNYGFANSNGFSFTGIGNPTVSDTNTMAAGGSTSPLSAGQTGGGGGSAEPVWPSTSDITVGQSAQKTSAKNRVANTQASNSLHLEQKIGSSGNSVNIEQTGNYNKISGLGGTEYAIINGDNNAINIKQGDTLGKNLIEFSVTGNTNNISIWQARNPTTGLQDGSESGGHYMGLNINGSTNTLSLQQSNDNGSSSGHFAYVDITGNNNQGTLKQTGNGEKTFFGIVNGNTNIFDITQQGSGSFLDLSLTGNGHNVTANQKDAGSHKATINLTNAGGASTVNLVQQGATAQNINITQQCATLSGCSVSVTQGQ